MEPKHPLEDYTINEFINFVNNAHFGGQTEYEMIEVTNSPWPELYLNFRSDGRKYDIQILYTGPIDGTNIGHYICIYHDAGNVTIYDSMYYEGKRVQLNTTQVIQALYPNHHSIQYVAPLTIQTDGYSCGLISIAHATALIFGKYPQQILFKMKRSGDAGFYLRFHLRRIFTTRKITPFPIGLQQSQGKGFLQRKWLRFVNSHFWSDPKGDLSQKWKKLKQYLCNLKKKSFYQRLFGNTGYAPI